MAETIDQTRVEVAALLDQIRDPYVYPKITLLVRSPDLDDGDFVLSDDDFDEAIAALTRMKNPAVIVEPDGTVRPPGTATEGPLNEA